MRTHLVLFACALLASGCGGRSVSSVDNQNNTNANLSDGSVLVDAEVRPDGGTTTCTEDDSWVLTTVPLSGIFVLNPSAGNTAVPQGVSVRVEALVDFTGCDQMAGVQHEIFPQDGLVLLTGYVWRYMGSADCPSALMTGVERFALRRLPAGDWELLDFMINGPGWPFSVRTCGANEDCTCDTWQGVPGDWGATCDFDCMCQPPLGCVMDGSGGCYKTCSVTSDCPMPLFCNDFLPQTSQGVCMSTGMIDSCLSDADCAAGFACLPVEGQGFDWCQPAMDTDSVGASCNADCDCPGGFSCVSRPNEEAPTCQIKCRGNRDCPRPLTCDEPGSPTGANSLMCR